ncbi:MAG: sulfite exporter TauE/SafE family protein [Thermodesulfovibrionales bacterium]|nr:sulfite exporter TauE/SafE family protein [Thermodesulfovibrionales bacterium]
MDFLNVLFPVSGVYTNILIPPLVAMCISFFTSMGGVSGAFLLLPFQVSVLNYTAPSVSGTNHIFNIVAIPSGVYRYIKEGRMAWPLTWVIIFGTLPGVFLGYYLRVFLLPDPKTFKIFVGFVLLYIGTRLVMDILGFTKQPESVKALEKKFKEKSEEIKKQRQAQMAAGIPPDAVIKTIEANHKRVVYEFWGERFEFNTLTVCLVTFIVGIIGSAYGIGGGAIIAPFLVSVCRLPIYTIAGAALMGTFITSVVGGLFFTFAPPIGGVSAMPDWPLGILFGIGGVIGMYLGARTQKFVPQRYVKILLAIVIVSLGIKYIFF